MEFEEDTYSSIFLALKHPVRRKILRMLDESPATYTEILNTLGVETGFLNYHLESLGPLVAKNKDGQYLLSEFGRAALALTTSVEAPGKREPRRLSVFGFKINPTPISVAIMAAALVLAAAIGAFVPQIHQAYITQTSTVLVARTQMETTTAAFTQTEIRTETLVLTETTHQLITANPNYQSIHSPTVIDSPGTYVLSEDISDSSVGTCIRIISSDVILDGQGHTIDGLDTDETYGVHVYNPSTTLTNVTVKNLRVRDWHYGIYYRNTTNGCIANNHASSNSEGIYLQESSNHTAINNTVSSNTHRGIYLQCSSSNMLVENNVMSNDQGIFISESSSHNIVTKNDVTSNDIHISYSNHNNLINNTMKHGGLAFSHSGSNNVINNTVNDGGIWLVESRRNNVMNNTVSSYGWCGIGLETSGSNNLIGNTLKSSETGIDLYLSNNNTLINNTASLNHIGFLIQYYSSHNKLIGNNASWNGGTGIQIEAYCKYNIIMKNTCSNNWCGIHLHQLHLTELWWSIMDPSGRGVYSNVLVSNTANSNKYGIYLQNAKNSTVTDNTVDSNSIGLRIDGCTNTTVTRNKAILNMQYGISLVSSSGTIIYDNYFDNANNARDDGENVWNIAKTPGTNIVGGAFIGGNLWSDYTGTDSDGDGLGDTRLPCDSNGGILYGGDFLPLLPID